ncbi:hypothetical protein PACTADRAFT_1593 [Pachysolen tannophilus NRRL Y-2460]|uniref:Uncharacterized protein n=1 Tax=Pachysolen tannophilus NRRL Y-2460 TaxID=669874 RepID=A0A1E4TZ42_PACTA|nr:hypothetical protein PACTADRAFT_1593 [Pachysolen tannophilus NRRL Y-2460]
MICPAINFKVGRHNYQYYSTSSFTDSENLIADLKNIDSSILNNDKFSISSASQYFPKLKENVTLKAKLHKNKKLPFNSSRDLLELPVYQTDQSNFNTVKYKWLQYSSDNNVRLFSEYLKTLKNNGDENFNSFIFWRLTVQLSLMDDNLYERVILPLIVNTVKSLNNYKSVFSLSKFYELMLISSLESTRYDLAALTHQKLYSLITSGNITINWLPIIQTCMLHDDSISCLKFLLKIHKTLDLTRDGFYGHIIPFLFHNYDDFNYLISWNNMLIRLGDLPEDSEDYLFALMQMALNFKFHKSILHVLNSLNDKKNNLKVNHKRWASKKFINIFINAFNFQEIKNQTEYLDFLLLTFSKHPFIYDEEFWFNVIEKIHFKELTELNETSECIDIRYINDLMKAYNIKETLDIYSIRCLKSSHDHNIFMKNFDSLINYKEAIYKEKKIVLNIPAKVLGVFIKILISHSFPNDMNNIHSRINESFKVLKQFSQMSKVTSISNNNNFFIKTNVELAKGFLKGLLNVKSTILSKYDKLNYCYELDYYINDILHNNYDEDKRISKKIELDFYDKQKIVELESAIILFKLKMDQVEQCFLKFDNLIKNIETFNNGNSSYKLKINEKVSHALVETVTGRIFKNNNNLELLEFEDEFVNMNQVSNSNKNFIYNSLKQLIKCYQLDKDSVSINTWRKLLIASLNVNSLQEIETFSNYLVQLILKDEKNLKYKLNHFNINHPLRILFSDKVISEIIKNGFLNLREKSYEPYEYLRYLLELSDKYNIYINESKLKKELKLCFKKLYIIDNSNLNEQWELIRAKNTLNLDEMVARFNDVWKIDNSFLIIDDKTEDFRKQK